MASPYSVKNKPTKRSSDMTKIAFMLIVFALVFGGFIYAILIVGPIARKEETALLPYPIVQVEDLGKTVGKLKEKYPDLFLSKKGDQ